MSPPPPLPRQKGRHKTTKILPLGCICRSAKHCDWTAMEKWEKLRLKQTSKSQTLTIREIACHESHRHAVFLGGNHHLYIWMHHGWTFKKWLSCRTETMAINCPELRTMCKNVLHPTQLHTTSQMMNDSSQNSSQLTIDWGLWECGSAASRRQQV